MEDFGTFGVTGVFEGVIWTVIGDFWELQRRYLPFDTPFLNKPAFRVGLVELLGHIIVLIEATCLESGVIRLLDVDVFPIFQFAPSYAFAVVEACSHAKDFEAISDVLLWADS
jgi:hypothetical protein